MSNWIGRNTLIYFYNVNLLTIRSSQPEIYLRFFQLQIYIHSEHLEILWSEFSISNILSHQEVVSQMLFAEWVSLLYTNTCVQILGTVIRFRFVGNTTKFQDYKKSSCLHGQINLDLIKTTSHSKQYKQFYQQNISRCFFFNLR